MPNNGQNWLSQGTILGKESSCPFCDQSIENNELVIAYRMFFSERYQQLQRNFLVLNNIFKIIENPEMSAQTNGLLGDYWRGYFKIDIPDYAIASSIYKKIEEIQKLVSALVQVRNENLDLDLSSDERLKNAYFLLEEFEKEIDLYNGIIKNLNSEIDSFKTKLQSGNGKTLQQEILRLDDVKLRSEPESQVLCANLKALKEQKIQLEREKIQKRSQLDAYTSEIFPKYQNLINQLLEKFGSTFSITGTSSSHMGGKPSASYKLVINNTSFDLGDVTTPDNIPSFRNTLSEGEKSTLAFCYFLARLSLDTNISNKIVLLDDPLSSFDSFRRDLTKQEIKRLSTKAKQIIILSHDQYFLKLIWEDMRTSKPLWINRLSGGSTIANWDIESTTQSSYFKDCAKLHKFLEEGSGSESEMRDIARAIRPVLEHNLRVRFPTILNSSGLWLGNFLDMINTSEDGSPIFICKPQYNDLDDINNFSKKYHHSENSNADCEPISSATLSLYVKKTLKAVAGIVTTGIFN